MKSKNYNCMDCNLDIHKDLNLKQDYMLHDKLWLFIVPEKEGILCISCAEKRLGRVFTILDYKISPTEIFNRTIEYKKDRLIKILDTVGKQLGII